MVNSDPSNSPHSLGFALISQVLGLAASFVTGLLVPGWLSPSEELQAISHQVEGVVIRSRGLEAAISELSATTTTTTTPGQGLPFLSSLDLDWSGVEAAKAALYCPRCDYHRALQGGLLLGFVITVVVVLVALALLTRRASSTAAGGAVAGGLAELARASPTAAGVVDAGGLGELARAQALQVRRRQHGFGR
jgi:hypothetical protein